MQRKPSYYLKMIVATAIAAAAGLAMGLQIETTHAITQRNADKFVVMRACPGDPVVQFAVPSPASRQSTYL